MCKNCLEIEINQDIISNWQEKGAYYGYPQCCIDEFIERGIHIFNNGYRDITDNQLVTSKGLGFIPCIKCADYLVEHNQFIDILIKNRICKDKFPDKN